jgi:hypothetical protein
MLGPITHRIATIVAGAAAIAALAPGLARAGTWLNPVPVNVSTGSQPSVALDTDGNTFATWHSNPTAPSASVVQAAHHRVGGTGFAALPDLSTDTMNADGNILPAVALNGSGNGVVAWVNDQASMGLHQLQFRTIDPDGTVGAVQTVPTTPSPVTTPAVAIDAKGDAVIAWEEANTVRAITRQGLNGAFNTAAPDTLSPLGTAPLSVAIDGAGNSIVVWAHSGEIMASRHAPGGVWSPMPDTLFKTLHSYSAPALAANASGQMVVALIDNTIVSEVNGTVSGGWGAAPTVTPLAATGVTQGPNATIDDAGGAAVGWVAAGPTVDVSIRPAGGPFPAPGGAASVTPVPSLPDDFTMSGNGRGDVVVAWYTFEGGSVMHNIVRAAVKPAGAGAFEASQIVSDPTSDAVTPVTALDGNGDAVVAYQIGNTPAGIGTATYDGAGPLLGTPTGASTVAVGAEASFSVAQPEDAFSQVASVNWSFGDGSAPATGAQVSHAFTKPGTFTVTVTATDAVGNASTATLHVTVTASPPVAQCVVPKLKGKSLSKAKGLLTKAHCALGKVHKPKPRKHHKLGKVVVKRSSPGAGATLPAGTKVSLTLTKAPKKHKHR